MILERATQIKSKVRRQNIPYVKAEKPRIIRCAYPSQTFKIEGESALTAHVPRWARLGGLGKLGRVHASYTMIPRTDKPGLEIRLWVEKVLGPRLCVEVVWAISGICTASSPRASCLPL